MGKLNRLLSMEASSSIGEVAFQFNDDGTFNCLIDDITATAKTPMKALARALRKAKRPHRLKKLRKALRHKALPPPATPESEMPTETGRVMTPPPAEPTYEDLFRQVKFLRERIVHLDQTPPPMDNMLVVTLVGMVRRASAEFQDRRQREMFAADLHRLLQEYGIEE